MRDLNFSFSISHFPSRDANANGRRRKILAEAGFKLYKRCLAKRRKIWGQAIDYEEILWKLQGSQIETESINRFM